MEHIKLDRAILIKENFSFKILGANGANVVRFRNLNVIERPENLFVNFEIIRHGDW